MLTAVASARDGNPRVDNPRDKSTRGGGVLPKKMGRGVRPASQNPYPIYE